MCAVLPPPLHSGLGRTVAVSFLLLVPSCCLLALHERLDTVWVPGRGGGGCKVCWAHTTSTATAQVHSNFPSVVEMVWHCFWGLGTLLNPGRLQASQVRVQRECCRLRTCRHLTPTLKGHHVRSNSRPTAPPANPRPTATPNDQRLSSEALKSHDELTALGRNQGSGAPTANHRKSWVGQSPQPYPYPMLSCLPACLPTCLPACLPPP